MTNTMTSATPRTAKTRAHFTADAALLLVAAIWGATFFMVKEATVSFPVLGFLALRFLLVMVIMSPLVIRLRRWPTRAELRWGLTVGVFLTLGYLGQTFAMRVIDAGRAGFITGLYVVMVPFLAWILLGHKITRRIWIGTITALVGLVLLGYAPGGDLVGDLLAVGCALAYALQILAVGKFPKGMDWRWLMVIQMGTVGVITLLLLLGSVPFGQPLPTEIPPSVIFTALFTGLMASGFGLSVQIWAQKILTSSEAAIIYAMESPFAAFFGVVFRGEIVTLPAIVGGGLIITGVLVTTVGANSSTDEIPTLAPELSAEAVNAGD